jgi:Bacterial regulatory proteins, luxR family
MTWMMPLLADRSASTTGASSMRTPPPAALMRTCTLVISERTAETHVGNILDKLGLVSRAQVTAWAMRHSLIAPVVDSYS